MSLFLSSQDLGKHAHKAAQLAGVNKKAAFIRNAQDALPEAERNFTTPEKKAMFEKAGFTFEEIDLRDYFGKPKALEQRLSDFGSVWCAGGNTFILRRAMKASGLDVLLVELLRKDKILYGGWSAGACITAASLYGLDTGDRAEPEVVPDNYPDKETIWKGLGLVSFVVVPHCDQAWFKQDAKTWITYLKQHHRPYKPLNDGQVVIVDGDTIETLK